MGYVWECGDDWCQCTEPRIVKVDSRGRVEAKVWEGTFRTDGEYLAANNELNRTAQTMRRKWHDAYRNVEWPWDRDE